MREARQEARVVVLVRPFEVENEIHRRLARVEQIDNRGRVLLRSLHVLVELWLKLQSRDQCLRLLDGEENAQCRKRLLL